MLFEFLFTLGIKNCCLWVRPRSLAHGAAWAIGTEPGARAAQPSPGLTHSNTSHPWHFTWENFTIFTIHCEYTSIYYLPHGLFHGSRIITDAELNPQSPSWGSYGLAALDTNAFEVKIQLSSELPWRLFCWGSAQPALVGCLKDFPITWEESVEIALILVKIPTEKIAHTRIFSSYGNCAGVSKMLFDLVWFILFNFIYLYVLLVSTISLPITMSTC